MPRIILGSQSPRRVEIFRYFNLPFEQVTPEFDEGSIIFAGDPHRHVCTLATGKLASLHARFPDAIVVTADTIVFREGVLYGKPRDGADARRILGELSGQWHSVYTAIAIGAGGTVDCGAEETRVLFNEVSAEKIAAYLHLPCSDKAGSYQIQGSGSLIVNRIEGCYYNVVGMPINLLQTLLAKVGVELWQHL